MLSGQISIVVNSYSFFSTQLKYNSLKDMSVDHLLLLLQLRSLRNAHHNTLYLPCFSLLECKRWLLFRLSQYIRQILGA